MEITLVIPTYNEVANLSGLVSELFNLPLDIHILVVDDNSPDGTGQTAEKLATKYPQRISVIHRSEKLGLGSAYIAGFHQALDMGSEFIGQMDADFSHPPEKLPLMVEALQNCDIVIGSRYVPGGSIDSEWPIWRKGLSAFGNYYARKILGLSIRDTTGAFRIWRREALIGIQFERIRSTGYVFMIECVYIAQRMGYSFQEVPIHFVERQRGVSKMSFQIQAEAAFRVWQIYFTHHNLNRNS